MGFLNSLFSSTQIKNAISIVESFLDDYDSFAGYKIKLKAIERLQAMDGDKDLWDLESEHIALLAILWASSDWYIYQPTILASAKGEPLPPYQDLKRLIDSVLLRMEKLDYMTKNESKLYLKELDQREDLAHKKHKEDRMQNFRMRKPK